MIKVYVVGGDNHYADFIHGSILTEKFEEADIVLLTGGEDVHPSFYDDIQYELTYSNKLRDDVELEYIEKAKESGKFMVGVCRGLQIGTVAAGGGLIQHMKHPHMHRITLWDNSKVNVNSLHHQMAYPYNLHKDDYFVIGHAEGISDIHFDGKGEEILLPKDAHRAIEPEIVYYPKLNFLGFQCHPEMMSSGSNLVILANMLIQKGMEGTILDIKNKSAQFLQNQYIKTIF